MRCLYDVLEIARDADEETIKKAYRQQALKWHPDKNQGRLEEAEQRFKEVTNAFEVLSDKHERQWYDDHRDAILRSGNTHQAGDGGPDIASFQGFSVEEIYVYFSSSCFNGYHSGPNGFYGVYSHVFEQLAKNEKDFYDRCSGREPPSCPSFGNEDSAAEDVSRFYSYWKNFITVMDFAFADVYNPSSAPNRRTRRAMEDQNQKARKSAKKEYVEAVRQLASFVKKRDVRVLKMEKEEAERRAAVRAKEDEQRRLKEEERRQQAAAFREADWITAQEEEMDEAVEKESEESEKELLWCVVCDKVFKSDKAMQNHEKSKKHKEKIAQIEKMLQEEQDQAEEEVCDLSESPGSGLQQEDALNEAEVQEVLLEKMDEGGEKNEEEEDSSVGDEEMAARFTELHVKSHKNNPREDDPTEAWVAEHKVEESLEVEDKEQKKVGKSTKSKKSRRSKKQKEPVSEQTQPVKNPLRCETCGDEFPSRNQLFKHITYTKHAALKQM